MAGRSVDIKVCCGLSILLLVHGNFGIENGRATGNRPLETTVKDADACRLGESQGRVTDGANATYGLYPWQVGIRIRKGAKYIHHCGGTILDNHFILSAAHCFKGRRTGLYRIRTGDNDNTVEETYESEFEIDQLYIPESYQQGHLYHDDVALIRIKSDDGKGIRFNNYVQPAFLPENDTKYEPGQDCVVSGWGRTSFKGHSPKILQCARVQLINDTVCSEQHSLTSSMVCAGNMTGGRDTCQGDSGGPLICEVNKRYTVMGITSWGKRCGQRNKPGVYTKVAAVLPWIQQTITGKCELLTESGSNYWRMENGYYVPLFAHTFLAHATEVFIACRRGFELFDEFGNIYMEREAPWAVCYFGIWKHPFFCRQKKCAPPLIKNGSVIPGLQDGIEIICDEGYDMLVGETVIKGDTFKTKCDRGLWKNELPSCKPGKCNLDTRKGSNYWRYERGQPVLLDGPHISHGDTVYINCQDGYELVNKNDELYIGSKDPQITCNYGNLTENVYKCQTTCLVPRGDSYMFTSTESWDPLNTGEMVMSEERVNVTCRMNTDGNVTEETITCTDEGTFTKITLNCPKPDRTNKGNNENVTCGDGYTLNTLECKPNDCILTTNMDRQMMVTKFGTNDVILKTGSVLKHNDRLIIDCQTGSEPRKRRFRCYLGNWTSDESNWNMDDDNLLPQCRKALCNPECQNHGQCARDNECHCIPFTTGDRCQTFMCNEACTTNGGECTAPDTCTCKENRYGNNCKFLACPLPVTNATITNEQKFYQAGERPELTCPVGMKLNVTNSPTCLLVHGSWSHSVNCITAHGTRCFTDSNCGDSSALTCKFGRCRCKSNYELMNSICKPKKCKLLIRPGSTYWTEDEKKAKTLITAETHLPHISRVFISCEDGYKLVNNNGDLHIGHDPPAVRCDYGFWRNVYHCVPTYGTRCFTVSDCGDSRSWTCKFGRCKCKANYKLLNSICKQKTCLAPVTNGKISHLDKKELYYPGNSVTITCPSGLKIFGGSKLTCEGEQWSHSGTCEYVFGTQCSIINDCADLADAVCQEEVCACQSGLKHVNGKCVKVLGSECFSDTDCQMTDVHCQRRYRTHAGKCNCKPGTKCGNTVYRIAIKTSKSTWESGWGEGTEADVHLKIIGYHGETEFELLRPTDGYFNPSSIKFFSFDTLDVGRVNYVKISLRKTGGFPFGDEWKLLWISIYSESRREYCIIQNTNWLDIGQTLTLPRDGRIAYFGEGRNVVNTGKVDSTVRDSNEYYCMVRCAKSYSCQGVLFDNQRLLCSVIYYIEQSTIRYTHHSSELFFKRL